MPEAERNFSIVYRDILLNFMQIYSMNSTFNNISQEKSVVKSDSV